VNEKMLRCAISDRHWFAEGEHDHRAALSRQAALLVGGGVDFFQLREKDLSAAELAAIARSLLVILQLSATKLLINTRADVALVTSAHGVHLTSSPDELTPRQVHALYKQAGLHAPIVTLSCHSLEDVVRHCREPLSAILFGPVFEKSVSGKRHAGGTGLDLLRQACIAAGPIPVLALGGVTPQNTDACLEAGASGVAGIRLFQHA